MEGPSKVEVQAFEARADSKVVHRFATKIDGRNNQHAGKETSRFKGGVASGY